jgi:hypothetical protein
MCINDTGSAADIVVEQDVEPIRWQPKPLVRTRQKTIEEKSGDDSRHEFVPENAVLALSGEQCRGIER